MELIQKKSKIEISLFSQALLARKEKRYDNYVSILREGLNENNTDCIYLLAQCYSNGYYGIKEDHLQYSMLLDKNKYHIKSLARLFSYLNKYVLLEESLNKKKAEISTQIINSTENNFAKGFYYLTAGLLIRAFGYFFVSAEKDEDDEGMFYLAECYYYGWGINPNYIKAFKWYLKSAEQGNVYAQANVARCYLCGIGTFKDRAKALYWYKDHFKASGDCTYLRNELEVSDEQLKTDDVDSLVDLGLARYYLSRGNDEYLAWYFYRKTKHKNEYQQLQKTILKRISNFYAVILTVLCIGKFSPYPKEVFIMIAKELKKTKNDKEWK